jgi:hypothetical protein
MTVLCPVAGSAQASRQEGLPEQVQQLSARMAQVQSQIEESQRQLIEMRHQLDALQAGMSRLEAATPVGGAAPQPAPSSVPTSTSEASQADLQDIRDRLAMNESQIATHDQTKVESESKYPVKVTGLLLLNGFVNTSGVDMPVTPTVAVPDPGSTGASVRQTVLGIDARGPHVFGAQSYADLRVDFYGSSQYAGTSGTYSAYSAWNSGFLRLRTAHAGLQWDRTQAYFSLDRPLFSPDSPTSLAAVAEPALAWSGNLWTWNPQVGVTQDLPLAGARALRLQAALMDVADAPLSPVLSYATATPPSAAEASRWPGAEARFALLGSESADSSHFGVGGYFAPHRTSFGEHFDSWAATADSRLLLPARLQFTASFYRGLGLGGLGGGGYKDFVYRVDSDTGGYYVRALDDVGGWSELKEKINERFELNGAFGMDNVFAKELRRYATPGAVGYQNLARNRTFTGNVIYSPSAYLLFSLEYRHLTSYPVLGASSDTNIIGLAAGYKF